MTKLVSRLARAGLVLWVLLVAGWVSDAAAMKIERVTSASGIEAWLVQDHSIPIVTLRFTFVGGANLDLPGKDGTAALAASLLDEGAGAYDTIAFHRRLDELAAEISFSAGHDEFDGTLRMLKTNMEESAELLRVALAEPRFAEAAVERVRAATLAALQKQARNPRSLSGRLWMSEAFERHPYGRNTSGNTTSVAAITRADLAALAARQFRRDALVIGAVGDITPAELATLLDRIFGGLPRGEGDPVLPEATPSDGGALLVKRSAVPQSSVTFGQAGLKRDDPDWYAAMVLNEILGGGGFRGRLMKEIREKRGLAYGVSTGLVPYRHAGLILGSVATENARVAESIALIRQEWQRMRDEGPTEGELHDAKTYLTGSFPLGLDSTRRIAGLLVRMQLDGLGIDYLDRRAELISGVTLDQARAVARRLYDPARLSFAVVGDPAGLQPTRPAPETLD
ncbi:MAG: M16 family metallopeptidase [Alphaproteobacteria bacterium]